MITRIKFPNESFYDNVTTFDINDFKLTESFDECVYGWWLGTMVAIKKEDYKQHEISL